MDELHEEEQYEIHFGVLHTDGRVTDERVLRKGTILACSHLILDPSHYREDGTCRCDDPTHTEMAEWEYEWKDGRWQ